MLFVWDQHDLGHHLTRNGTRSKILYTIQIEKLSRIKNSEYSKQIVVKINGNKLHLLQRL